MTLQELGRAIREKREAAGLSIDDVAARIKISGRILRAVEEGSSVGLPHAVYTKSFIRSFGLLVDYDPATLNAALEELFPPESLDETKAESALRSAPINYSPGLGKRYAAIFIFLLVLAGLAGGCWYVATRYGDAIWEIVKQPFSAITSPGSGSEEGKNAPAQSGSTNSTFAISNTLSAFAQNTSSPSVSPSSFSAGTSPPSSSGPDSQPVDVFPADSPAPAGVDASEANAPSGEASDDRSLRRDPSDRRKEKNQLLITVDQACWISSRADGARGRGYTLQPNESFVLTYADTLELTLGNAGGVSLEHNGKKLGRPGGKGQRVVLRFPISTE